MDINGKVTTSTTFWLNFAAELVFGSLDAGRSAADRLQKAIGWVFAVYSSIGMAAVLFGKSQDWSPYALMGFGMAFLFLILGYWQATVATFVAPESFYSSAEASIREALTAAVKRYKRKFSISVFFSSLGTVLYAVSLLIQFYAAADNIKKPPPKPADNNALSLNSIRTGDAERTYAFQLGSKKSSWNEIYLIRDTLPGGKSRPDTLPVQPGGGGGHVLWLYADTSGMARFSLSHVPEKGCHLDINRVDSLNGGRLIIRSSLRHVIN